MVLKRNSVTIKHQTPLESLNSWWRESSPYKEIYETTNERKIALLGLILSLSILTAKVVNANRDELYNLMFEKRLIRYETIVTDGEVMLTYAWTTVCKYSKIWFPALCGCIVTRFTWIMVFLDSCVPGIMPPSPLSPNKFKIQSGHTFHLNYVFAIGIGVLVAAYMYINGIGLSF